VQSPTLPVSVTAGPGDQIEYDRIDRRATHGKVGLPASLSPLRALLGTQIIVSFSGSAGSCKMLYIIAPPT
jgi:hypothetical protein